MAQQAADPHELHGQIASDLAGATPLERLEYLVRHALEIMGEVGVCGCRSFPGVSLGCRADLRHRAPHLRAARCGFDSAVARGEMTLTLGNATAQRHRVDPHEISDIAVSGRLGHRDIGELVWIKQYGGR
ncbi:hypothetical protein AB0F59_27095 [Micromonospora lupini]|uniref:hypothetical protein n=1 Tax=Micromonospora lupini TaxID=285679 RepID=UPI0033F5F9BC